MKINFFLFHLFLFYLKIKNDQQSPSRAWQRHCHFSSVSCQCLVIVVSTFFLQALALWQVCFANVSNAFILAVSRKAIPVYHFVLYFRNSTDKRELVVLLGEKSCIIVLYVLIGNNLFHIIIRSTNMIKYTRAFSVTNIDLWIPLASKHQPHIILFLALLHYTMQRGVILRSVLQP